MKILKLASSCVLSGMLLLNGCATSAPAKVSQLLDAPYATDSENQKSDDLALKHKLQDMLDAQLVGNDIRVVVTFSNVLLVGQVVSDKIKDQASAIAKTLPNVKKVLNYLSINSMPSFNSSSSISNLATERIGLQQDVYAANLTLITVDGVIYIMGSNIGSLSALNIAAQSLYSLEKVTKVVNLIQKSTQDY